ncbi:MAG TPA: disulfide oxidoreductase [Candidatus Saccharimonadia bacterium]
MPTKIARRYREQLPYVVWVLALLSMAGSLAMSEVFKLTPCVLCWYQRILMYPLVVIVGVGIMRRQRDWVYYALPLVVAGTVVAGYHSLLQWGIIPEAAAPCSAVASCALEQINWLGFVTIPFMSFLSFLAIAVVSVAYIRVKD